MTETGQKVTYTYDDLVTGMKADGWNGSPLNVVRRPDGSLTSIKQLSSNYPSDRVMIFESDNVKDISDLAMDTNFAKHIGQEATAAEYLVQANARFIVTSNDGVNVTLRSVK